VISFHSLEDRLVKHAFADMIKRSLATRITKKPLTAGADESRRNPRARSAKLRAIALTTAARDRDGLHSP
jgi:16S rRNA (cytosine1402-N4)-methyltransferase